MMPGQMIHEHIHDTACEPHGIFEQLVSACLASLSAKDPATREHSERVAGFTVNLAEAVNKTLTGVYGAVNFTCQQIEEIKYASLLHDFGKICIDDEILQKDKKLHSHELERIQNRFHAISEEVYSALLESYLHTLILKNEMPTAKDLEKFKKEASLLSEQLETYFEYITVANDPNIVSPDLSDKIAYIARAHMNPLAGGVYHSPLLTIDETKSLSLKRGTLTEKERREIETHVQHAHHFLSNIPWAAHLKNIPEIVYNHHERLDGSGYPRQLKGPQISVQAKMVAITDIFDALVTFDRPYKRSMSREKALDILSLEVSAGKLDGDIFNIFVEANIGNENRSPGQAGG